jgi:dihydrolipoamide dehydrogenase
VVYDTIIIGGGPAGYLAAERLAREKKKVLIIEERHLGGTCLNAGCIPTKTLLNSAKLYVHAKEAQRFGVKAEGVSFDWLAIQNWKTEVVQRLRRGIEGKLKSLSVDMAEGRGEIINTPSGNNPAKVGIVSGSNPELSNQTEPGTVYEGKTLLICTGSAPAMPPIPGIKDNPLVVDSTGLLNIEHVPEKLAIIGGGVIGVEFAGLFSALGSKVTVIEMMDEILPFMDKDQSPLLRRAMKDVEFKLGCRVEKIEGGRIYHEPHERKSLTTELHGGNTEEHGEEKREGAGHISEATLILIATGRVPITDTWGAKAAGIDIDRRGVRVDEWMRTNVPLVWAAGDVTGKSLLAHSAYRMAEVAAASILAALDGRPNSRGNIMRYNAIPWAVYGLTEAAGVGFTEQEAVQKGIATMKATVPMKASGRFAAENGFAAPGAVKVLASASDRHILGIHAVGAYAPEFIWGGAALIEQEFRIDDVKQLIFPHPTVSELIRDAVWEL